MIFFRKRRPPVASVSTEPKPLNPDFNFWENRTDRAAAPTAMPSTSAKNQTAGAKTLPVAQTSAGPEVAPDKSHTLLVKGKWVRPWGLRNFGYSFAALIGVVVVLNLLAILFILPQLSQMIASDSTINSDELTKKAIGLATTPWVLILSQFSTYAVWLGYMWWSTRYRGARSWAIDFKLWFRWWDVLLGLGTAWAVLGLSTLVTNLIQQLAPNADYSGMDNGAVFSNQSGAWFFIIGIGIAGIIGPICEELYFRGFFLTGVQRWLARYAPNLRQGWVSVIAIVLTSILFGLVHFQGISTLGQILVVFFTGGIGVVLALYRVVFKRLGPGIFTHIGYNTTALLLTYFATLGS